MIICLCHLSLRESNICICFLCLSIGKYSKIMLLEIMKVASTLKLDFKHFLLIFKNILKSNLVFL